MGKKKANGTAKRQAREFYIGAIPRPAAKLTPKRAQEWLRRELGDWNELMGVAAHKDPAGAEFLGFGIRQMAEACQEVMAEGRSARLSDDYYLAPTSSIVSCLELVQAVLDADNRDEQELHYLRRPLSHIVAAVARAAAEQQEETRKRTAPERELRLRRSTEHPMNRIHRLRDLAALLFEESEKAEEPWRAAFDRVRDEVLERLTQSDRWSRAMYARKLLEHEAGLCEHPGDAPEGFDLAAVEAEAEARLEGGA